MVGKAQHGGADRGGARLGPPRERRRIGTRVRWRAASCVVLVLVTTAACGRESASVDTSASTTRPGGVPVTATPTSVEPPSTSASTPPTVATPQTRTVPLGQTFLIAVGESLAIAGERLIVGYRQLLSDSRCPLAVQCITAGNAAVAITLAREGSPPATVNLHTTEGPMSAQFLTYTVELVDLSRGSSPAARLRVR